MQLIKHDMTEWRAWYMIDIYIYMTTRVISNENQFGMVSNDLISMIHV